MNVQTCGEPGEKVTRFEVIDESGRMYVIYDATNIVLNYQDDGKTLKVFVSRNNK